MYEEHDERFRAAENRKQMIEILLYLITVKNESNSSFNEGFPIYQVNDMDLDMYVTTEEDLEDGHTIRPDDSDLKLFTF